MRRIQLRTRFYLWYSRVPHFLNVCNWVSSHFRTSTMLRCRSHFGAEIITMNRFPHSWFESMWSSSSRYEAQPPWQPARAQAYSWFARSRTVNVESEKWIRKYDIYRSFFLSPYLFHELCACITLIKEFNVFPVCNHLVFIHCWLLSSAVYGFVLVNVFCDFSAFDCIYEIHSSFV